MEIHSGKETVYQSPLTRIIEIAIEGILCESGDGGTEELGENMGSWGW